jgi:hypothetical protein
MTPLRLLQSAIEPAAAELAAGGVKDSPAVSVFLLAIALQESGLRHRRQVGSSGAEDGPASGYWQFEKGGGCRGVLRHRVTAPHMRRICDAFDIEQTEQVLWEAMRYQDIVAAVAARLLVLSLPDALPTTAAQGWTQYLEAWRPGKPHPATWAGHWATAEATIWRKK